ncbi:MAG: potassium transporter TrkG [Candidatus Babeliales bacterium]|nr:potassium transporter TrkG [Candidatus Babeliales bacterium]
MNSTQLAHISPGKVVLGSVFFTILVGALLLALPQARNTYIPFIDLLFTATSATCVTGLLTIHLSNFTLFGKGIILMLVQIGGLGLITMTLFVMSLFINMGMTTQLVAGKILELESWKNIKQFIVFIIMLTLGIELIGVICMLPIFLQHFSMAKALFLSTFYSISSFCNAGISLFDGDMRHFSHHLGILSIVGFLVFCGGFGFITWHEIMRSIIARKNNKRFMFSLHSKIIMYGTLTTITIFAVLFLVLEHNNTLSGMPFHLAIANALFHGITMRSAGILSVPFMNLQLATIFIMMVTSFIGSAPGSTGSGIKITTFALFLATIKSAIRGKTSVEIWGRTITRDQVFKSIAIVSLGVACIGFTTFMLLITENMDFTDLFIEAISGFTNLGISTGITPMLSILGKIFIMLSMIIGRIGALTLILAFKLSAKPEALGFSYPEERVMLS